MRQNNLFNTSINLSDLVLQQFTNNLNLGTRSILGLKVYKKLIIEVIMTTFIYQVLSNLFRFFVISILIIIILLY